jgi:hypothetical protein
MATRSRIGIELTDAFGHKQVKSIYCHWDGYPEGVGQTLMSYYQDREKVSDLMHLGALSFLEENIEKPAGHSFDTPVKGYTLAYHRDRGDKKIPARVDMDVADFFKKDYEQYGYVLTEEGEWLVARADDEPVPLSYVLSGIEK